MGADPSFQLHGRPRRFSGDFHEPNSRQDPRGKDRHQRILLGRRRKRRKRRRKRKMGGRRRRRRKSKRRRSRRRRSTISKVSRCLWLWYYGLTLIASPRVRSFVRSFVRCFPVRPCVRRTDPAISLRRRDVGFAIFHRILLMFFYF